MSKVFRRWLRWHICAGFLFAWYLAGNLWAQSSPIVFNTNGGWNWCQDERVIINNNKLIFGSVAEAGGTGGAGRDGNVELTTYDLSTLSLNTFVLHANLDSDDHAAPALMVRPDGKILAVYTRHNTGSIKDYLIRYRITTTAGDTSSWDPELTYTAGAFPSYSNVYRLSSEGKTYDFYRGENYNPNVIVSSDDGTSWSYGGRLIRVGTGNVRPYGKYISNNTDKIYFIYTDGHPRDVATSLYSAYLQGGVIYNSNGVQIGILNTTGSSGIAPSAGTKMFNGDTTHRAWGSDLQLDSQGYPVATYSVHISTVDPYNDHRYRYARWNGTQWNDYEIAYAGKCLYVGENDYTGLISLNPSDPNTVYISTSADPVTGTALSHFEVYRGFTNSNGASWTWTPITANSTNDNVRPTLPSWDGQHTALVWLQSLSYTNYWTYNQKVVGYVFDGANGIWSNVAGGDWTSGGNWQSGLIASGKLGIADFSTLDVSGTAAVQLNGSRTLGFLVFGDKNTSTSGNWVINPGSGGTITLENLGPARPTITVQNQTATINVPLAGTQGLDVKGNGTLILGAANTYGGGTTIYAGSTLQVGDGGALPVAGTITNNASLVFKSSGTLILNGAISGSGTLTLNGSGTVIIGGNNSYTGATNVGGYDVGSGTLRVTHSNALGSSAVTIGGHNTCTSRLELVGGSGSGGLTISNAITLAGRSDGATPGLNLAPHLVNMTGDNTLTANVSLNVSGADYIIQSDAGKLTLNSITNNSGNAGTRYVYLQGAGDGLVQGTIGNGTGTGAVNLIKDGAGTWTLTQDVAYMGNTTVMDGVLELENFNPATSATATVLVQGGAQLIADSIMVNSLTIAAGSKVTIRPISGGPLAAQYQISSVPEPATITLLMLAGVGLGLWWLGRKGGKTE